MKGLIAGLLIAVLAGPALADDDRACSVASGLVHADFALPHVAKAIDGKQLTVAVVGSASSSLPGLDGASKAYPARLQSWLQQRLPGVSVKVVAFTKVREAAADMAKGLQRLVAESKPELVVWQTGTVDAMLGVDPDDFQSSLGKGLDALRDGKADAVLMNMQYSPRTDSIIALNAYMEAMRFVALQREIPLFDRLAVMKDWNEMGVFDLSSATKKSDIAERVHECIGRLLARLVVEGASLARASNTGAGNTMENVKKDTH